MLHEVVWVSRELAVDIGDVELQVRFEAVLDELHPVLDNNTRRKNIGKSKVEISCLSHLCLL